MKKIVAIAFSVVCSLASTCETYPYSTLQEILPYHQHSQYQNAAMMGYLIKNHHVKVVVEVGSWMGASTIDIAEKIPEDGIVYAVDHWLGTPGDIRCMTVMFCRSYMIIFYQTSFTKT